MQVRAPFAQDYDAGANDDEGQQGPDAHERSEIADGDSSAEEGDADSDNDGGDPRGAELGMDFTGPLPQETVVRHGVKDSRLAEEHDQHDGAESGECAGVDDVTAPHLAGLADGERDGSTDVETIIVHDAGEQAGDEDVKDCADDQRAENADRHIALRILGFLCRGRDSVEADVGEEDDAGGSYDSGPTEGQERMPVGLGDCGMFDRVEAGDTDEHEHGEKFYEDNASVEVGGFLDADHKDRGDTEDGEESDEIEDTFDMRERLPVNVRGVQYR